MDTPEPEDQAAKLQNALFSGQKIVAVKLYREQTGTSLLEAKQAVEKLEADLRLASPERFSTKPAGAGCATLIAAGLVVWKLLA